MCENDTHLGIRLVGIDDKETKIETCMSKSDRINKSNIVIKLADWCLEKHRMDKPIKKRDYGHIELYTDEANIERYMTQSSEKTEWNTFRKFHKYNQKFKIIVCKKNVKRTGSARE